MFIRFLTLKILKFATITRVNNTYNEPCILQFRRTPSTGSTTTCFIHAIKNKNPIIKEDDYVFYLTVTYGCGVCISGKYNHYA